jgi:hypothetical protein
MVEECKKKLPMLLAPTQAEVSSWLSGRLQKEKRASNGLEPAASTQRNQYKTVFQKKQEYAQSISKIHQAERSNLESEDLWLAKYIGMVMIVEGTTRIVTSVEFSHGKNAWILKAQKAKQSEYDDREYLPEQGGDVCEIDVKTHGKTSSNAYIKAFNAHYASLHNSN